MDGQDCSHLWQRFDHCRGCGNETSDVVEWSQVNRLPRPTWCRECLGKAGPVTDDNYHQMVEAMTKWANASRQSPERIQAQAVLERGGKEVKDDQ